MCGTWWGKANCAAFPGPPFASPHLHPSFLFSSPNDIPPPTHPPTHPPPSTTPTCTTACRCAHLLCGPALTPTFVPPTPFPPRVLRRPAQQPGGEGAAGHRAYPGDHHPPVLRPRQGEEENTQGNASHLQCEPSSKANTPNQPLRQAPLLCVVCVRYLCALCSAPNCRPLPTHAPLQVRLSAVVERSDVEEVQVRRVPCCNKEVVVGWQPGLWMWVWPNGSCRVRSGFQHAPQSRTPGPHLGLIHRHNTHAPPGVPSRLLVCLLPAAGAGRHHPQVRPLGPGDPQARPVRAPGPARVRSFTESGPLCNSMLLPAFRHTARTHARPPLITSPTLPHPCPTQAAGGRRRQARARRRQLRRRRGDGRWRGGPRWRSPRPAAAWCGRRGGRRRWRCSHGGGC